VHGSSQLLGSRLVAPGQADTQKKNLVGLANWALAKYSAYPTKFILLIQLNI
jgi:hypothetical protein